MVIRISLKRCSDHRFERNTFPVVGISRMPNANPVREPFFSQKKRWDTHKDGGVGMRVVTVIRKGWDVKCEGGDASQCFL